MKVHSNENRFFWKSSTGGLYSVSEFSLVAFMLRFSCSLCIGCVHRMCISATAMTLIYLKCRKKEEVISAMKWQKKQIQTINHDSWSQSARQTSQIAFLSQTISLTLVSFFCQSFSPSFSIFLSPLFYFLMWLGKKNPLVLKYYKSLSV